MAGLGDTLRDARLAKGLSLEDVEHDTRIVRRYLEALEQEDREALPAPVYARGFLRTYARYLGLNADDLVRRFFPVEPPAGMPENPLAGVAAPTMGRQRGWIGGAAIAAVLAILLVVAVSALRGGGDSAARAPVAPTEVAGLSGTPVGGRALPIDTPTSAAGPRTIDAPAIAPPQGSDIPDFRGRDMDSVLVELAQLHVPYLIVEAYSDRVDAGKVFQQTPRPGAKIDRKTSVTLVVSHGPAPAEGH